MMNRFSERAPSERARRVGFGYKIDYDAAIAEDEKQIAQLSDPLTVLVSQKLLPAALKAYPDSLVSGWSLYELLAYPEEGRSERAEAFGLSLQALQAWGALLDDPDFGASAPYDRQQHLRGEELDRIWSDFRVCAEPERLKALRGAKASLSRHRRNRALHVGSR